VYRISPPGLRSAKDGRYKSGHVVLCEQILFWQYFCWCSPAAALSAQHAGCLQILMAEGQSSSFSELGFVIKILLIFRVAVYAIHYRVYVYQIQFRLSNSLGEITTQRFAIALFPVAAARAWNSLPPRLPAASSIVSFRRELKTYLFLKSFSVV